MIQEVFELSLEKPLLAPDYVWEAYKVAEEVKSERPKDELTALVSLIRRACGIDPELKAFDSTMKPTSPTSGYKRRTETLQPFYNDS
jgi:type I restriction enzyme R subunit